MDRDVGFNPRRGGNCCPAPAVFDQAHGDQVRAETTAGILPQMVSRRAGLLPTERETKVMSHGRSISVLPIFASDEAIAEWLMGPGKANDWRQIAVILETRGLPKVDALMGGRYTPAVTAFFDREYGLNEIVPRVSPSGAENLGAWNRKCSKQR
jgi:hypothetical protein